MLLANKFTFALSIYFKVLEGDEVEKEHCVLDFAKGKGVKLEPISALCWVNGVAITQSTSLNQGNVGWCCGFLVACIMW